ncbi:hypothetical protein FACS189475_06300 [Betaproteobacteria bacterium]|nr:hypothetical protein FACS189475_06300 [Betaproteobacteria bacterium]
MTIHSLFFSLLFLALVAGSVFAAESEHKTQTLCGWFQNPTPANAWLQDRSGEWFVSIQGGRQAEGDWPEFDDSQWVKTNGHYGYGCACIKGVVNVATHDVISISSARAQSLSICRKDRTLKEPEH